MNLKSKSISKHKFGFFIKLIILGIAASCALFPIIFALQISLSNGGIGNYVKVFEQTTFLRNLLNSVVVTSSSTILVIIFVSMAAFAFSKLEFPLKKTLYMLSLMALMIPATSVLFPLFTIVKKLGLIDNFISLIGPYVTFQLPFQLVILKNYYDTIPNELMDSAKMDGCGVFKTLWSIFFPMSVPSVVVITLLTILGCWNEFTMAFVFIDKVEMRTLPALPSNFVNRYGSQYNLVFACLILIELPVVIVYLFTQEKMQKGLIVGAIKG